MRSWIGTYRALVGRPDGKKQHKYLGITGRILKWIFMWDEKAWTGFLWL
jgi:hypothetical protein